jgi:RHS repeat-associated protein
VAMEVEVAPSGETEYKGKVSRYVLSGDLLAGRTTTTLYPDDSTSVAKSWYHLDHLNSTKAVSDEAVAVEVRYEYRAFGEQLARLGDGEATYTYSGKELDEATNLYYFNARYYDPAIGRFITLDPVQDGSNWYVYCDNNPLSMVDPTGLIEDEIQPERSEAVELPPIVLEYFEGDVSYYTGEEWRTAEFGDVISPGHPIAVAEDSHAEFNYRDIGTIKLFQKMIVHSEEFDLMNAISHEILRQTDSLDRIGLYCTRIGAVISMTGLASLLSPEPVSKPIGIITTIAGAAVETVGLIANEKRTNTEDRIVQESAYKILSLETQIRNTYSDVHALWEQQ